ncbi:MULTISPECIES: TetR/AcrR family transcriptional regulator [Flavobacteriaceae]|uniref:TetR/AcrR family transcriptional regulator n=1 Tax=Flavobacteriaceae TaxID=49546 RepID=UPI0014910D96|nr:MULTISPECIES: TetR/AcrR family transcriptional regulator [Allomuricauda]MDC6365701.1 TetR family transcriptional regulator C-terminal domain-containing protein [Muricauda sp. AC10]
METAKESTLHRILTIGGNLIIQKGFNNVGLNEILSAADIPKGSFYYYFKSKEDFGLQVIKNYGNESYTLVASYLRDKSKNPKERFMGFFKDIKSVYVQKQFTEGCLLGNCSLELSDVKASYAFGVSNELKRWEDLFEECIQEGQRDGSIGNQSDSRKLASYILNNWEGAILRMKSQKSEKPLSLFIEFTNELLI